MPLESNMPAYDKDRWMRSLEAMAAALGKDGPPVKLCLIDSAEDIHFLHKHYQPDIPKVKTIISGFPDAKRETAEENLVYLEILR